MTEAYACYLMRVYVHVCVREIMWGPLGQGLLFSAQVWEQYEKELPGWMVD